MIVERERADVKEEPKEDGEDEEEEDPMAAMMGFGGFGTTKVRLVSDPDSGCTHNPGEINWTARRRDGQSTQRANLATVHEQKRRIQQTA